MTSSVGRNWYDCPICFQPFVDPQINKSCGHTICRECAKHAKDKCSQCRANVQFVPNFQLKEAIESYQPEGYKRRKIEVENNNLVEDFMANVAEYHDDSHIIHTSFEPKVTISLVKWCMEIAKTEEIPDDPRIATIVFPSPCELVSLAQDLEHEYDVPTFVKYNLNLPKTKYFVMDYEWSRYIVLSTRQDPLGVLKS